LASRLSAWRAFKAATGKTLHRFVLERRIERAKQMLQQDHSTLADIAYACGFCSQAHLTSVFAQHAQNNAFALPRDDAEFERPELKDRLLRHS
jgi:AraC-like DNA-binding protein